MPAPQPTLSPDYPSITQKTGMSIALVVVLVTGILANVTMMFTLKSEVALVQKDVGHVVDDTREIRAQIGSIRAESREELRGVRSEVEEVKRVLETLRERVVELEKTR